jgi:Carboxypeptidase regulatory-like domain
MPTAVRRTIGVLLLLCACAPLYAQFETASIVGTVHDTTGAVVPGTTVTLTSTATGVALTRTSATDGSFEFFTVKDGVYVLTAEKTGFSIALVDNVQVQVGGRLRVDLQLPVGQVSEKVEVTATVPLLETESSQRGQVVGGAQITALPLNGREYSALALLTTGVRPSDLNRGGTGTNREGSFNVNGLRSMFNNFLIDGVDNNAYGRLPGRVHGSAPVQSPDREHHVHADRLSGWPCPELVCLRSARDRRPHAA